MTTCPSPSGLWSSSAGSRPGFGEAAQPKHRFAVYSGLFLSEEKHLVTVDGKPVELTYKEFELLKLLLSAPGNAFTRDVIMERIWGYNYELSSRTLDMHVKTLRQKLGAKGAMIQTIRNVGFKLERLEG